MIFVFGGAYQGKLDFAKGKFNIEDERIFTTTESETDFVGAHEKEVENALIIDKIEDFCFACAKEGIEARDYLAEHREKLKDKIIISRDVSQGLVPMDPLERAYREMMGRMMIYLSGEAEQVYRVLAGLGQRIR